MADSVESAVRVLLRLAADRTLAESDFKAMISLPIRFPEVAQEILELDELNQSQNQRFGTRLDRETRPYLFQEEVHRWR